MFEPTTLPRDSDAFPLTEALMLTTSSGNEVPAATIVSPTTVLLTPKFIARFEEPSTSLSAAYIRITNPIMHNNKLIAISISNNKYGQRQV